MLPPAHLLLALLLVLALHAWLPLARVDAAGLRVVGGGLASLAVAMILWCAFLFRRAGTTIKPFEESSALLTQGPYRFSRNPIYLSMAILLLGVALFLGSIAPLFVVPLFALWIDRRFVRAEQAALAEKFGSAYEEYRRRARRWI